MEEFIKVYTAGNENKADIEIMYNNYIKPFLAEQNKGLEELPTDTLNNFKSTLYEDFNRQMVNRFIDSYLTDKIKKNNRKEIAFKNSITAGIIEEESELNKTTKKDKYNQYMQEKCIFIQDFYGNTLDKRSIDTYISVYKTNIIDLEVAKNKHLYDFNDDDMLDIFSSMNTTSMSVLRTTRNFINAYMEWADARGMILTHTNPLLNHSEEELFQLNVKMLKIIYPDLDTFYKVMEQAILSGASYQDCIILVLARYGVEGKQLSSMLNAKFSDIDRENMYILVDDRKIKIDQRFIDWINKAEECNIRHAIKVIDGKIELGKYQALCDCGDHIVKNTAVQGDIPVKSNVCYVRVRQLLQTINVQYRFKDLVNAREFDILYDLYRMKGKLIPRDFVNIHKIYYPDSSISSYVQVAEKFKLLYPEVNIVATRVNDAGKYDDKIEMELGLD